MMCASGALAKTIRCACCGYWQEIFWNGQCHDGGMNLTKTTEKSKMSCPFARVMSDT